MLIASPSPGQAPPPICHPPHRSTAPAHPPHVCQVGAARRRGHEPHAAAHAQLQQHPPKAQVGATRVVEGGVGAAADAAHTGRGVAPLVGGVVAQVERQQPGGLGLGWVGGRESVVVEGQGRVG